MQRKHADWDCPQCGYDNFGSNDKCNKCGCYRSKAIKTQQAQQEMKKGDWRCTCGELVFASRNNCRRCDAKRPTPENTAQPTTGILNTLMTWTGFAKPVVGCAEFSGVGLLASHLLQL